MYNKKILWPEILLILIACLILPNTTYGKDKDISSKKINISEKIQKSNLYDQFNRLRAVIFQEVAALVYQYDNNGSVKKLIYPDGREVNYVYDGDNRLKEVSCGIDSTTYTTAYTYDTQTGNLKKKISPTKTAEYEYDYENRLIRYNDGVSAVEYEYNGDGIRFSKTVNGEKTIFINDIRTPLTQVSMECTGNWYITKRYVYGRDLISQEE